MRATAIGVFALLCSAPVSVVDAAQAQTLVADVRAAVAKQDFARGERLIAAHRADEGVTPLLLEALSWMGRGALAAGELDRAEAYARQTYDLTLDALKRARVDDDPRLATALGASIEVLAQSGAKRGARSEAVAFLRQELERWNGTSLRKRIQKNLNLLSLEGLAAPALDLADYVGPRPPAVDALQGRVVLLFFWAHWCGDCKAQVPVLARLLERYGPSGLTVIGPTQRYGYVAGGKPASAEEEAQYIDQVRKGPYGPLRGMPVPIAASNLDRYGVSTTPTLVLIDRRGAVRLYRPGRMTEDELDPLVRTLIGDRRP
jgi:thiol-disulfide isomerase/thioredoxin